MENDISERNIGSSIFRSSGILIIHQNLICQAHDTINEFIFPTLLADIPRPSYQGFKTKDVQSKGLVGLPITNWVHKRITTKSKDAAIMFRVKKRGTDPKR